jgi:hypothetical protein
MTPYQRDRLEAALEHIRHDLMDCPTCGGSGKLWTAAHLPFVLLLEVPLDPAECVIRNVAIECPSCYGSGLKFTHKAEP